MKKKPRKLVLRRLTVEIGLIGVLVIAIVVSTFHSWQTIKQNNAQVKELNMAYTSLLEQEKAKKLEESKLHDEDYLARIAREKYYYSKGDELIIRVVDGE